MCISESWAEEKPGSLCDTTSLLPDRLPTELVTKVSIKNYMVSFFSTKTILKKYA